MTDKLLYKVNGNIFSWASTELVIGVSPFVGLTEFSYGQKRTHAKVPGMNRSRGPLGVTSGVYEADPITMKMLANSYVALIAALSLKGLGSAGSAVVPITWKCFEPKRPPLVMVATNCRLEESKTTTSEGPEGLMYDLSWITETITENGAVLYSRGPL